MIEYGSEERRMVLEFVYLGPALSGKPTNLLRLPGLLAKEGRRDPGVLEKFRVLSERAHDVPDRGHDFAGMPGLTRGSNAERLDRRAG